MLVAVVALVSIVRNRSPKGLAGSMKILASGDRFDSNAHAAQAMYDASRQLLIEALSCRDAHRPEERCRPYFEAAAIGQATTANLAHCRAPIVFSTRQAWVAYLRGLRNFQRGKSAPPPLPAVPDC